MADFVSTDKMYRWDNTNSQQDYPTWADHKAQLTAELEAEKLNEANGFDLQDPDSMGTLTWDDTTRQFTLAVTSGQTEFTYWIDGVRYTSTSSITSTAIPDTTGTYYVYLLADGTMPYVLESGLTSAVFYEYAIVGLVYWNATAGTGMPFEERHGIRMDSSDHEYEHKTIGARYSSGLALTGLVDGQSTFTGINSGVYYDEDIKHTLSSATTMPFMYRLGAGDGEWTFTTADDAVGYKNGGTHTTWNENTGTAWQLTQADSAHDYILIFVLSGGTLSSNPQHVKLIDQAGYSSRAKARAAIEGAKKQLILDGLPSPEFIFIGVYICRASGALEGLADGSVYLDLRGSASRGSGGDSAASNKAADITVDASGFSNNLSTSDTDVQTALATIDSMATGTGSGISLLASDPASPSEGDIWINTTDNQMKAKTATGTIIWDAYQYVAD